MTSLPLPELRVCRLPLDTGRENIAVMSRHSLGLRPEGFRGFSRVEIRCGAKIILATLLITDDDAFLKPNTLGLADPAFRRLGQPADTLVSIAPAAPPESFQAVHAKIDGRALSAAEIDAIVRDLSQYRYSDIEIAALLVGTANFMTDDELLALTRSMADAGTKLSWNRPMVVDKHCIGGIPGNRTTMIVVPIVAAHGLMIPKTSSRAITSPAGTADTMEMLARVDLDIQGMKDVVDECGGCIIWGGHVNLSPADDVLIGVERPLSLDTRELMVASIMSKKLAAGSSHLLIDIPVGPSAKIRDDHAAMHLRKLFEFVGDKFGLSVQVVVTDGSQPVGRGIGPALEARDVMAVLNNDPKAPADLREKSLQLAGHILEHDPQLRGGKGYARARDLLASGAALKSMQKIIKAQGPSPCDPALGPLVTDIVAGKDGVVKGIDCLRFNRLARLAGAPLDRGAGVELFKKIGDRVQQGEPLYRIYSCAHSEFEFAVTLARANDGYLIGPA